MRKTQFLAAIALLAIATPATAQHKDPTTQVKGSGALPADWALRFDPPAPAAADKDALKAIVFDTNESGFRIASGPAAIYYNTKDVGGTGEVAVTATFTQSKDLGHEAAGLFIGGSNLQDAAQSYIYFVVRAQDGMAMISQRSGDKAPKAIKPYFAHTAINKQDATGRASNTLLIHVAPTEIHFVANGQLVATVAKSELNGAATAGNVGLRVNHNMDLQITGYKFN